MNLSLFNIVALLNRAKEFLTQSGSPAFREVSKVLGILKDAADAVAGYIDTMGVQTTPVGANAAPGTGLDSSKSQDAMRELVDLYHYSGSQMAPVEAPGAGRGPLTNILGGMNPNVKTFLWGVVQSLITQVLLKSGVPIPGASDAGVGTAASEARTAAAKTRKS